MLFRMILIALMILLINLIHAEEIKKLNKEAFKKMTEEEKFFLIDNLIEAYNNLFKKLENIQNLKIENEKLKKQIIKNKYGVIIQYNILFPLMINQININFMFQKSYFQFQIGLIYSYVYLYNSHNIGLSFSGGIIW